MNEKDKIIDIILNTDVTERTANNIADDLIENGIGDISEWKARAEIWAGAMGLVIKEIKSCPYPPETIYNPDSEGEEQVYNCDFGDNMAECEECIMRYFLRKAEEENK